MVKSLVQLWELFSKDLAKYRCRSLSKLSRAIGKRCNDNVDTIVAVAFLNTKGFSKPAIHNSNLISIAQVPASGPEPHRRVLCDLLPISPVAAESFLLQGCSHLPAEYGFLCIRKSLSVLSSLNFLMGVGWTLHPILPKFFGPLSSAQKLALDNILRNVQAFLSTPATPFNLKEVAADLKQKRIDYSGSVVAVCRQIQSDLVVQAWPQKGQACVCNIIEYVDQHLADDLKDPRRCLLQQDDWPEQMPQAKVNATDAEWYKLCVAAAERKLFAPVSVKKISQSVWHPRFKRLHGR